MRDEVARTIARFSMIKPGDRVLCALSGGADSTALLRSLLELRAQLEISICAAHVNHGLRADAADADEAFCRSLCGQLNVPFYVCHADVSALARQGGESAEMAGRRARYRFFEQLCDQGEADVIATAHTADDNAETVLLRLARGTALRGLCGIPPMRGRIIRPLLFVTRAQVEQYLAQLGQDYRTDESNYDNAIPRNRIRAQVMPALRAVNPRFSEGCLRTCELLRQDEAALSAAVKDLVVQGKQDGCFALARRQLLVLPEGLRARVLLAGCRWVRKELPLSKCHLDGLNRLLQTGGRVDLPGSLCAWVSGEQLRIAAAQIPPRLPPTVVDHLPFCCRLPDGRLLKLEIRTNGTEIQKKFMNNCIDYGTISGSLLLRSRKEGDTYAPAGFAHRRSVKKMMIDQKIPAPLRAGQPLLCMGDQILWCAGLRPNHAFRVTAQSKQVLCITIEDNEMKG